MRPVSLEELNAAVEDGSIDELIRVAEAAQVKALSKIADRICERNGVRLVLLAGASSAGKTTTAKRLCTQLRVNDRAALHLSTDDYFVGPDRRPIGPDGLPDYEALACVDSDRLAADLRSLFAGSPTRLRRYDFVRQDGYDAATETRLAPDGIVVLEGIHALNPQLSADMDDALKFRVFVEPKAQPALFADFVLPSADARFLRRLVRDRQFRKMPPEETFALWPKVLEGEKKWINPFRPMADAEFDSALCYELVVLKPYVEGLLRKAELTLGPRREIERFLRLFEHVLMAPSVVVPGNSILRETIGGSVLDY